MSLTSALSIAQSALLNTSRQTSIVSRNIAEAGNTDYARRSADLVSTGPGARVAQISRATNEVLFRQNLAALSQWQAQDFIAGSLDLLNQSVNGIDHAGSPAAALTDLQTALQTYSANPSNRTLADNAVEAARNMVRVLNYGTDAIQTFRADTDRQITLAVSELNGLLSDFADANKAVVQGTRAGRDVSDALDQRDALLKKIAEYVPVSTISRADNDMMLLSSDGAILFETVPREVTFDASATYVAGVTGNSIYIDGVALSAGTGTNTSASGRLGAMIQMRDTIAPTLQNQLDEIARSLITSFAETDPAGIQPDMVGLFTWPGAPAIPAAGTLVPGLAGSIGINPAMDASVGGDPELLRDGGANGAAYVHNASGGAAFSGLLHDYAQRLEAPMAFDGAGAIGTSSTLSIYTANAISWIEQGRQEASRAAETKTATLMRTSAALSNETGVNVDEEMALLLDLEHSYEASARIIRAVDEMLATLLAAVN